MPIAAVGNPNFEDFVNPKEARATKRRNFLGIIHQIRQASIAADFNGKSSLVLNIRFRQSGNGVHMGPTVFSLWQIGKQKGKRRLRTWVIIGRFGRGDLR